MAALETGYPGGIRAYLKKARELLGDAASGANPFSGYTPKVYHEHLLVNCECRLTDFTYLLDETTTPGA